MSTQGNQPLSVTSQQTFITTKLASIVTKPTFVVAKITSIVAKHKIGSNNGHVRHV